MEAATEDIVVGHHQVEGLIPAGLCRAHLVGEGSEDTVVGRHRVAGLIPPGQCRARLAAAVMEAAETAAGRRVVDREEETPQAVPMAALLITDAIITKRFPPRFTPHLTHRQEAPKGASCPP